MSKILGPEFWNRIARSILRNRMLFLGIIFLISLFMIFQWREIRFTYTEANLLPDNHVVNQVYDAFLERFGEEGNVVVLGIKDSTFFTTRNLEVLEELSQELESFEEVDHVLSLTRLQRLQKLENPSRFEFVPLYRDSIGKSEEAGEFSDALFDSPFYEGLIYNESKTSFQTAIYLKKAIVNTKQRKDFIIKELVPLIEDFEEETDLDLHVSGMPYIRTLNAITIIEEIGLFIGAALLVTSLIFFFFFRSVRATLISVLTVTVGVIWAFGFLGLLQYEITVLTAIIPPLIIVIGIPNCIFFINKYQQEIQKHGNQAKSLQRVITRIGNATLMTNLTTASGFATFIFTNSQLLQEFGVVAAINILVIFLLSILIIPIVYSFMRVPKYKHLKHLDKQWMGSLVGWMEKAVKKHRAYIYFISGLILLISIIGISRIRVSGSLLEDMPEDAAFYKDIRFFEKEFGGVLPLEIVVDSKRKKGIWNTESLQRIDSLHALLDRTEGLSKPLSVVNLVKYGKQAYYNNNPEYYELPSQMERSFILPYADNLNQKGSTFLNSFVDSTGQYARITTFMQDLGTNKMSETVEDLQPAVAAIFPKKDYDITFTGKALLFQQGTRYLVKNLMLSLGFAIVLIAFIMAWMFRSFRMILISLLPNLLPLLMTAGLMGFLNVPLKPSTILVFSIAFGISVDDTIHFLAKYRQELQFSKGKTKKSVFAALKETGVSMFYTSVVLFFGFSVFTISSFGGTVALGGLISATLFFAMLSNLLLLPSLLLSFKREIADKDFLQEPVMDILGEQDQEKH